MAARLLRCTRLWGTDDWLEAEPALRRIPLAAYRPSAADAPEGPFTQTHGAGAGPVEEGPFLYIGAPAAHYGHFLINTLPRLWPLVAWEGRPPRILYRAPDPAAGGDGTPFLRAILGGLGIEDARIVAFDRRVTLSDVLVPEPALREQAAVHAVFAALCRGIGRPIWEAAAVDSVARPLYLSKTRLGSGIAHVANEEAIVEALERRGVEIAFPETLGFAEQVRLLSTRRVVTGTLGSAFHTAAFAAPGRRLVGLNWQTAVNANFALLDRVNGARARYYHPHGTLYEEAPGWHVVWRVADPGGVADALLRRVEWLDRDEPDDAGPLGELRRRVLRPFRRAR